MIAQAGQSDVLGCMVLDYDSPLLFFLSDLSSFFLLLFALFKLFIKLGCDNV